MMTEVATSTEPVTISERRSDRRVEIDLLIPAALSYFQGHFRNFPVLPGVVQLHWTIAFGRRHFSIGASPPETMQLKFRSIIVPNERICLMLGHEAERRRLSFEYRDAETVRSSGLVTFAA